MQFGLFLRRAFSASVRARTAFHDRVAAVIQVVGVVAGCVLFWDRLDWDRTTVGGAAGFGLSTFGVTIGMQALIAMALAGGPSIASERGRKSLDSLLATRLSSAEIVLGMMGAGVIRCANWTAATLPVVVGVAIVGGVHPFLALLTAAGLVSSVFFAAALAVTVSVHTRDHRRAVSAGIGALITLLDLPLMGEFILPRVWPGGPRWLFQALHWLVDSTPAGVGIGVFLPMLVPRPFGLVEAIVRMIALQFTGGSVLVLWAAWQLRPASRRIHDGEWPPLIGWMGRVTRRRPRPRRPCGDDSVLWNELNSQRTKSLGGRLLGGFTRLAGIAVLVVGTSWFAIPAFSELAERGYGATREGFTMPDGNPFARVLIGKLLVPAGSAAPGQARLELNVALRQFSAVFVMLYVVMVTGTAATSVIVEVERNTWQSLIATSLTGWEILRAKMLGAIWRGRGAGLTLIGLWVIGLVAGAVHPVGFLGAVAGLIVIGAFYAALGAGLALQLGDRKRTNHTIIFVVLCVLPLTGLAILLPGGGSVALGACSCPFLIWSSLFSYEDIQSLIHSGVLPQLGGTSLKPGASARSVLAGFGIAALAHAFGAFILTRLMCRRFDWLVGRPVTVLRNATKKPYNPPSSDPIQSGRGL